MQLSPRRSLETIASEVADETLLVAHPDLQAALRRHCEPATTVHTPESAIGWDRGDYPAHLRLSAIARAIDAPLGAVAHITKKHYRQWRIRGTSSPIAQSPLAVAVDTLSQAIPSPERALRRSDPLSTATILDRTAFDTLQQGTVPSTARVISSEFEHAQSERSIDEVPTREDAIEMVIDIIEANDPAEVGVILDCEGPYWPPLVAALRARNIATTEAIAPSNGDHEAFLRLIELIALPGPTRVRDARVVLAALGLEAPTTHDNRPIGALEDERATWIEAITTGGNQLTLGEVFNQFTFRTDRNHPKLARALATTGLDAQTSTRSAHRDLTRYLTAFARECASPSNGVELASACDRWYVDRPITIALGPARSWQRDCPEQIDTSAMIESHRLSWLFASGDSQHVLIAEADDPTGWIETTLGCDRTRRHLPEMDKPEVGFAFTPEKRPGKASGQFSQSSMNRLSNHPREWLFQTVLDTPDRSPLTRGTLIHEYAEMLLANPQATATLERETVRSFIEEAVGELEPWQNRPFIETRIHAALAIMEAFADSVDIEPVDLDKYAARSWQRNRLAERCGIVTESAATEQYFVDEDLGVSGIVDLIVSETELVDFKTGSPRPLAKLIRQTRGESEGPVNVQSILYLAALSNHVPDRQLHLTYLYCYGDLAGALSEQPDLEKLSRTVSYIPEQLREHLAKPSTFETLYTEVPEDHPRRVVLETIELAAYRRWLEGAPFVDHELPATDAVYQHARDAGLPEEVARAGVRSIRQGVADRRERHLFVEDVDAFEERLDRLRERLEMYRQTRFPRGQSMRKYLDFPDMHTDQRPTRSEGHR